MRKNAKRRLLNSQQRARLRTYDKKVRGLVEEGKLEEAKAAFVVLTTYLDRAGKRNLIHPRQADRRKARMSALLGSVGRKSA